MAYVLGACVRMEIGRDIVRRVNGLGDFEQRTFWVVTEETPQLTPLCSWPLTTAPKTSKAWLSREATLLYGVTRVCRFSPPESCHLPSPRLANYLGNGP